MILPESALNYGHFIFNYSIENELNLKNYQTKHMILLENVLNFGHFIFNYSIDNELNLKNYQTKTSEKEGNCIFYNLVYSTTTLEENRKALLALTD